MGLLKQYRAKATTFRDGKKAADFESKEQNYTSIITTTKKQQRGVNEGKNGFTSSPNNKTTTVLIKVETPIRIKNGSQKEPAPKNDEFVYCVLYHSRER